MEGSDAEAKGAVQKDGEGMTSSAFIGRMRARMNRATAIVGICSLMLNIANFAILIKLYLGLSDLPSWLIGVLVLSGISGVSLGFVFLEERHGWWGEESRHIWALAGWNPDQLTRDVAEIKEMLKR